MTLAQHRHDIQGLESKFVALGAALETKMDTMMDTMLNAVRSSLPVVLGNSLSTGVTVQQAPANVHSANTHVPVHPVAVSPVSEVSPRPLVRLPQPGDAIPTSLPEPHYRDGEPKYLAVIRDWKQADPSRGLYYALKDWEPEWYSGGLGSRLHGAKYSQRRWIAREFIEQYAPSQP